jgi:hypothetical protein
MEWTMPFSKYTADPDLMEAMRTAFYRARDILQLSCDRDDPLTDAVITKIVEIAKAGERDPDLLCSKSLAEIARRVQGAQSNAMEVAPTQTEQA